jgi:hypothetical protein
LVRDIQPPVTVEDARVVSCPWVIRSQQLHLVSSDDANQFRNGIKPCGCTVSVGSEEARLRAGLRPPLKLYVPISGIQLSRRHPRAGVRTERRY